MKGINQRHTCWKGRIFTDNMIDDVENPKNTKELLELISEF